MKAINEKLDAGPAENQDLGHALLIAQIFLLALTRRNKVASQMNVYPHPD